MSDMPPPGHPLHPEMLPRTYAQMAATPPRTPYNGLSTRSRTFPEAVAEHTRRIKSWLSLPEMTTEELDRYLLGQDGPWSERRIAALSWTDVAEALTRCHKRTEPLATGRSIPRRFRRPTVESIPVWRVGRGHDFLVVLDLSGHLHCARGFAELHKLRRPLPENLVPTGTTLQDLQTDRRSSSHPQFAPAASSLEIDEVVRRSLGLVDFIHGSPVDVEYGDLPAPESWVSYTLVNYRLPKGLDPAVRVTGARLAAEAISCSLPSERYGWRMFIRPDSAVGDESPKYDGRISFLTSCGELVARRAHHQDHVLLRTSADAEYSASDVLALALGGKVERAC